MANKRICSKCGKKLNASEFYSEFARQCKSCVRERQRAYTKKSPSPHYRNSKEVENIIDAADAYLSKCGIDFLALVKSKRGAD